MDLDRLLTGTALPYDSLNRIRLNIRDRYAESGPAISKILWPWKPRELIVPICG
jgi:hypothetical protein